MKKLFQILVFSMMFPLLTGCGSDLNPFEDGHHRAKREKAKPVLKTFRMSFGGDIITESEESLQRADDGETYVAINVYRSEKTETGTTGSERYAYGLFKGRNEISIDLVTGYVYTFRASIIIEDRDKVALVTGQFQDPFRLNTGDPLELSKFLKNGEKVFIYHDENEANADREYFNQLESGTAYVDISEGSVPNENEYRYPRVKRFYGKKSFDPSTIVSDDDGVVIPMTYKSFGLKIKVGTMPANTYVTVKDITTYTGSDPGDKKNLVFTKGLKLGPDSGNLEEWEGIFSLNKLDDESQESQEFTLQFTWHKLSGSDEVFEHDFTAHARKQKVLTLNVSGYAGEQKENKNGNITFSMDDEWEDVEDNYSETVTNQK